jgi:hypothetical protein
LMEFKGPQGDTLTTHLLRITINAEHQLHHISLTQGTLNGTAVAFGEVVNKSSNTRVAIVDGLGALPIVEVIKLQSGEWKALVNATAKTPDVIINRVTKP